MTAVSRQKFSSIAVAPIAHIPKNWIVQDASMSSTATGLVQCDLTMLSSSSSTTTAGYSAITFGDVADWFISADDPHIRLKPGIARTLELPDGTVLDIDADGKYRINGEPLRLSAGMERELILPDGTTIHVDHDGNYILDDSNAQVVYKGNRIREFNRFINASDILEDFIKFVAGLGVKRNQLLQLPVELFIKYLIVRSAEEDGEDLDSDMSLDGLKQHPALAPPRKHSAHCLCCGRFIKKFNEQVGVLFCGQPHMLKYAAKQGIG